MIESHPALVALPAQPDGLAWPTEAWARGPAPDGVDVEGLVSEMFADARYETTYALLVVHHGQLVAERYGNALPNWVGEAIPVDRTTPLLSWSMAKSNRATPRSGGSPRRRTGAPPSPRQTS